MLDYSERQWIEMQRLTSYEMHVLEIDLEISQLGVGGTLVTIQVITLSTALQLIATLCLLYDSNL